jgi:Ca2+-binding RTX toxin-like protein
VDRTGNRHLRLPCWERSGADGVHRIVSRRADCRGANRESPRFPGRRGTEYSIRIAGYSWNALHPFRLHWGKAPANDAFSNATVVAGSSGNTAGTTVFATDETGEPARRHNTVWYKWTAPATGHVRFDAWRLRDATWDWVDTVLIVHTGASVPNLKVVARNDNWFRTPLPGFGSAVSFRAVAGTTYSISVDTYGSHSWGPFGLRWYRGAIVFGGSGNDHITGTPGRDYLSGGSGHDVIHGLAGQDVIVGSSGRDRLYGDRGADALNSRDWVRGNDVIYGGPGRDTARRDRRDGLYDVP